MRDRGDQVGLVYCWSRAIDERDRVLFDITPCIFRGNVYTALILRNFLSSGAPLVRRRCVEELGGYDATLSSRGATCCEDLKFNLEVAERYDFDLVPEFLLAHRIRAGSMSTDSDAMLRSYKVVIEEVRTRHPELPARLFRWADGHQHLELGLTYVAGGQWATGSPTASQSAGRRSSCHHPTRDEAGLCAPLEVKRIWCARKSEAPWRSGSYSGQSQLLRG